MREIKLGWHGKQVALVDDEDFDLLSKWKWHVRPNGTWMYAIRQIYIPTGRYSISMHRSLLKAVSGQVVDHINGDGLDNRRCNIRVCSQSENSMNRRRTSNSSGFKGVSRHHRRWRATISVGSHKHISLGSFDTPEEAAAAYDNAARLHFGQFAGRNAELIR